MENIEQYQLIINKIMTEIKKVVVGKDEVVERMFTAILAKGHILIEDIPGVGKTTLAMAFSRVMDMECNRMQFTPDVLPTDVIGFSIYDGTSGESTYRPGSIMCNLFLADEINRTSSKTQSALLEVMEEGRVTVDGVTRVVPKPFTVIATQNPIGSAGTQLLPESQLDRFMVRLCMGYPDAISEIKILKGRHRGNPLDTVDKIIAREELLNMQAVVDKVFVHDAVYDYISKLVARTRTEEYIEMGVSPRGTLAVANMAKAAAFADGRGYMIPDDIKRVFKDVVSHRILLKAKARVNRITTDDLLNRFITEVSAPKLINKNK